MKANLEIEQWIADYGQKLFEQALYFVSNREDAEDIVQDVFVSAFSRSDTFKGNSSRLTWLMGILRHKVADHYKTKYKTQTSIRFDRYFDADHFWKDPDSVLTPWDTDENHLLDDESFIDYLQACLEALPERWLVLVKLTYLDQQKSKTICQETGISTTNYWKILQRSRLQLRECLQTTWFEQ